MTATRFGFPSAPRRLLAMVLVALGTAGCSDPPVVNITASTSVTVTDALGRQVAVPSPAKRIVSLAPSHTETLFAIGAGDCVVGVTALDDYPPQVKQLEVVGSFAPDSVSIERIVHLAPDVVLAAGRFQRPVIDALAKLGIPALAIEAQTFAGIYENIQLIGRLADRSAEADRIVQAMSNRLAKISKRTAGIEQRLRVLYLVWEEPVMTVGQGAFIDELLASAGGVNVFGDVEAHFPQVSVEEVLGRKPEVILAPAAEYNRDLLERLAGKAGWQNLPAVVNKRVHLMPEDLVSRPGPRSVEAAIAMARALYPDLFAPEPGEGSR